MASADTAVPRKRGRPSTGARERILEAASEVLRSDGYAGLTIAKVAARAGESKALIAYHYGSKDGLVAAAGQELAEMITAKVLKTIRGAATLEEIARGVTKAIEQITKEDERIPRSYFDLAAVSVVEPEVRKTIEDINRQWSVVLEELITNAEDAPPKEKVRPLAVLLISGVQGLALQRIERGPSRELTAAREMFVRSVVLAV